MEVAESSPIEAVRASVADVGHEDASLALQSTVATARKVVGRALEQERAAERAALSLAQRTRLGALCGELEEVHGALEQALTDRGRALDEPVKRKRPGIRHLLKGRSDREEPAEWDEAIEFAVDSLRAGADLLSGLARGQRPGSAAHAVAASTSRLLHGHCGVIASQATGLPR